MIDYVDKIPGATCRFTPSVVETAYTRMADWATDIVKSNNRPTMLVSPMQGSLFVLATVAKQIQAPVCYKLVKVSLYDSNNKAGESATFDYWPITEKNLGEYDFIFVDDVLESMRTCVAVHERLAVQGASVKMLALIDKPVAKRVKGWSPDFAPLHATENDWLIGEGMNNGSDFFGEASRCVPGVWVKNP